MKREKIYNYFYIANNLLNGHFYLGVHSTDTLADGYFGSGLALKKAIKSYGKENFELTPLKFFKTRKELMDFEREIVNERFLTYYKGICYNLKRGGEGRAEPIFTPEVLQQRVKDAHRRYEQNHKEEILTRRKKAYHKKHKAKRSAYYQEHKEERAAYMKEWRRRKKAAKLASQQPPVVNK